MKHLLELLCASIQRVGGSLLVGIGLVVSSELAHDPYYIGPDMSNLLEKFSGLSLVGHDQTPCLRCQNQRRRQRPQPKERSAGLTIGNNVVQELSDRDTITGGAPWHWCRSPSERSL
jgi:hypothetical protein